ncbi:MAG: phosphoglucosamine mutase [Pseudomonadota bacterium]|mgnify:FL=1|nr:phosphoglucosamine mutase [Pseudomonadota bacterium]MEC8448185.1 phosphoglucosamine mutase [Pseudomonadota bacterium]|tara:strand:- start:3083 stop:4429 length:1347 start_codon:yes stop_codon:yes gene_type:complete
MNAKKYFGTDGIRGLANQHPITAEVALQVGIATGLFISKDNTAKRVIIAKDTRLSGYMLESSLTSGLTSVGLDVFLLGPMPTPAVSMLIKSMRADLGIMISASHNTYEYNGIKIFGPDGYKLDDRDELEIEGILGNIDSYDLSSRMVGKAKRIDDAQARYIEYVKGTLDKDISFDGIKVVIDSAHGAAYKVAPLALWELGANVISIGDSPNGKNINHEFGSTSLGNLKKAVSNHKADIGIALDGDADRIIVIDETGNIVDGDALLAIIATEWKKSGKLKKNAVVATILSNIGLESYLSKEEMKLFRTNVGDRYVSQFMRENGYNIGGEQSGHIIIGDYSTTGDGLLAAIQILSIMKKSNKKISALARLIKIVPQIQRNYKISDYEKINTNDIDEIHEIGQERIKEKGRILVRLSGTEPLIRVMGESQDKKYLNETLDYLMDLIEKRFN